MKNTCFNLYEASMIKLLIKRILKYIYKINYWGNIKNALIHDALFLPIHLTWTPRSLCTRVAWLMAYMHMCKKHSPCSYVTKQVSMLQRVTKSQRVHKGWEAHGSWCFAAAAFLYLVYNETVLVKMTYFICIHVQKWAFGSSFACAFMGLIESIQNKVHICQILHDIKTDRSSNMKH